MATYQGGTIRLSRVEGYNDTPAPQERSIHMQVLRSTNQSLLNAWERVALVLLMA